MIATSQALASSAGLKVLQDGGNAVDAAVTAAAVLAVVEPSMNGIGGDLLAIVWDTKNKRVHALDATGRSAYAATPEEFARRGLASMPGDGPLPVDVPGVVDGWDQLLVRFGTIPLAAALQPAIRYARDGFPVQRSSPPLGTTRPRDWRRMRRRRRRSSPADRRRNPVRSSPIRGSPTASS